MARIQEAADQAGPMVKLVYRFRPRMMKKLTGREPPPGSGIEPMEIWAHQPKMMSGMGKFHQAVRKGDSRRRAAQEPGRAEGRADDRLRVLRRPRLADLSQLRASPTRSCWRCRATARATCSPSARSWRSTTRSP